MQQGCNLSALLEVMQEQFSREPPVYAKPKNPVQLPPTTTAFSAQTSISSSPVPALPPKPGSSRLNSPQTEPPRQFQGTPPAAYSPSPYGHVRPSRPSRSILTQFPGIRVRQSTTFTAAAFVGTSTTSIYPAAIYPISTTRRPEPPTSSVSYTKPIMDGIYSEWITNSSPRACATRPAACADNSIPPSACTSASHPYSAVSANSKHS